MPVSNSLFSKTALVQPVKGVVCPESVNHYKFAVTAVEWVSVISNQSFPVWFWTFRPYQCFAFASCPGSHHISHACGDADYVMLLMWSNLLCSVLFFCPQATNQGFIHKFSSLAQVPAEVSTQPLSQGLVSTVMARDKGLDLDTQKALQHAKQHGGRTGPISRTRRFRFYGRPWRRR